MTATTYRENTLHMESRQIAGTADLSATLSSGVAVVDATAYGEGLDSQRLVTLTTSDAHGFAADSQVYIEGTTNYDGIHDVTAVTTSGITIRVPKYVAETPDGTETVKFAIDPGCDFVLYEATLTLSDEASTSENFVMQLDSRLGSSYDHNILKQDVDGYSDIHWSGERFFFEGDIIRFTLPNSDSLTYGLEVKYRRVR